MAGINGRGSLIYDRAHAARVRFDGSDDEADAEVKKTVIETKGMRHVALRVADVERSRRFYCEIFGMRVVWQPDPDNAYLSSGTDNLALHRQAGIDAAAGGQALDHIGFFVADLKGLERAFAWAQQRGLTIVKALRRHRDGTSSFYIADPDGVVVQLIYDPSTATA